MSQSSLILKPIEEHLLSILRAWRNDERVYHWCRQYEPISQARHEEWFRWQEKDPNTRMYCVWVDGQLVGVCGLTSIDWINRRAEFSLYIGPENQGKGFGSLALEKLCQHGFRALNLNCIWGEAFDGNPAIEMFKSIGFKEEGRRREFYYRDGKYIDAVLFSLLRSEYACSYSDSKCDSVSDAGISHTGTYQLPRERSF